MGSEFLPYEDLILSPGGVPRKLPVPGSDLPNVYTLRSVDDAEKISDAIANSFIWGKSSGHWEFAYWHGACLWLLLRDVGWGV